MTSFHFVPTLERTTRESALASESSPFVRQRGILCGYFIVVPYSTVNRPETFVAGFAPNRLRHPLPPLDSKDSGERLESKGKRPNRNGHGHLTKQLTLYSNYLPKIRGAVALSDEELRQNRP